jgi:hypothetical protein
MLQIVLDSDTGLCNNSPTVNEGCLWKLDSVTQGNEGTCPDDNSCRAELRLMVIHLLQQVKASSYRLHINIFKKFYTLGPKAVLGVGGS